MPDMEKVIEALHCRAYDDDLPCSICAYYRPDEKPVAKCDYSGLMDDAIALLKEQDAVVRCKDCIWFEKVENALVANQRCRILHRAVANDWYCADGERKK